MHLFDLRTVALLASIAVAACSDDGVPQSETTDGGESGPSTSGTTSATTTATVTNTSSETLTGTSMGETTDPGETTNAQDSSSGQGTDATGPSDSSTSGPNPGTECDGGCTLVDDCCNCVAIGADEDPPACDIDDCEATACAPLGGAQAAVCEFGSCELAPVPCSAFVATCKEPAPDCPPGTLPSVDEVAECWTGQCVPAEACDFVPDCESCPEDETCVSYVAQLGPIYHCSPIDPSCGGTPSCACMGDVCIDPFDACGDDEGTIGCACPAC